MLFRDVVSRHGLALDDFSEEEDDDRNGNVLVRISGEDGRPCPVSLPLAFYRRRYDVAGCSERQGGFRAHLSACLGREVSAVYYRGRAGYVRLTEDADQVEYPLVPGMVLVACVDGDVGPPRLAPGKRASGSPGCPSM